MYYGQANLDYFLVESDDQIAQIMLEQLKTLVNEGINGKETQNSATISVAPYGNLLEEEEYYSQSYRVSSPVDLSTYTITNTSNLPEGTYIANSSGVEKTTFSNNESFKIMIPKVKLTSDINGTIEVQAKCKRYPVFYGETTIPGTQDYVITNEVYGDFNDTVSLNLKTNTGKIIINKVDMETSEPLEGVKFELRRTDGTAIGTAITNSDGIAEFLNLYQEDYILKEMSTNSNYVLSDEEIEVSVFYDKETSINITNEYKKGNLKVVKVDEDDSTIKLSDVEFNLLDSNEELIGTYITDSNGEIFIEDLKIGNYTLKEVSTQANYILNDESIDIKIEYGKTTETIVENQMIDQPKEPEFFIEPVIIIEEELPKTGQNYSCFGAITEAATLFVFSIYKIMKR